MRSAAYVLFGLLLIVLQGTLFRFFAGLSGATIFGVDLSRLVMGATPNLVLPLVIHLGIHEESMARGAVLSFCLGWGLDVLGGGPAFLFRFTMVGLWWLSRVASSRLSTQSIIMRIPLALVGSLFESAIVLTLLAIFGADSQRPRELLSLVVPRALGTAAFAPFCFALARRLTSDGRPGVGVARAST